MARKKGRGNGDSDVYPRATLLVSKNVNPKIVQEMLGHATISQTMDTYTHVMPGMQDAAVSAMEAALL